MVSRRQKMRIGHRLESGGKREIAYARSETHVINVLDSVCDDLQKLNYKAAGLKNGRWLYVTEEMKDSADLEKYFTTGEEVKGFRKACTKILENDDELIQLLVGNFDIDDKLRNLICDGITRNCKGIADDPDAYRGQAANYFIEDDDNSEL